MKYYFIEKDPIEHTFKMTEYDTLTELEENESYFITNYTNWYIMKGEIIKCYLGRYERRN